MTQATYLKHTEDYVGKHAPKTYFVQTVGNSNGLVEGFYITGLVNVRNFIKNGNFFDWRVFDSDGKTVDAKHIIYGGK